MHPLVRDLYKRFLIAGRHHPQGLEYVKERVKKALMENANILTKESNELKTTRYNNSIFLFISISQFELSFSVLARWSTKMR